MGVFGDGSWFGSADAWARVRFVACFDPSARFEQRGQAIRKTPEGFREFFFREL